MDQLQTLQLACVQMDIFWEQPEQNLDFLEQKIAQLNQTDIVVLPEMFPTGFTMAPEQLPPDLGETVLEWMLRQAEKWEVAITGSVPAKAEGGYVNRMFFVHPDNTYETYDKVHLFSFGKEADHYQPGRGRPVIQYRGWRIAPFVCYDLRFPVWMRNDREIDLYIGVANWPSVRIQAWTQLLKARAIENLAFVVGVNRVGKQPDGLAYSGQSMVVNFDGNPIWEGGDRAGTTVTPLHREQLIAFRKKYRFLEDRDSFEIKG